MILREYHVPNSLNSERMFTASDAKILVTIPSATLAYLEGCRDFKGQVRARIIHHLRCLERPSVRCIARSGRMRIPHEEGSQYH